MCNLLIVSKTGLFTNQNRSLMLSQYWVSLPGVVPQILHIRAQINEVLATALPIKLQWKSQETR